MEELALHAQHTELVENIREWAHEWKRQVWLKRGAPPRTKSFNSAGIKIAVKINGGLQNWSLTPDVDTAPAFGVTTASRINFAYTIYKNNRKVGSGIAPSIADIRVALQHARGESKGAEVSSSSQKR